MNNTEKITSGKMRNKFKEIENGVESLSDEIIKGNALNGMSLSDLEELIDSVNGFEINSTVSGILTEYFSKIKEYRTENPINVTPEPEVGLKDKRRASNKINNGNRPSLKIKQDKNDDEVN